MYDCLFVPSLCPSPSSILTFTTTVTTIATICTPRLCCSRLNLLPSSFLPRATEPVVIYEAEVKVSEPRGGTG